MADWSVKASKHSLNTINPVREAVANILLPQNFHKQTYSLALGDPSIFPDFAVHPNFTKAVLHSLKSGRGNGYTDSRGSREARVALAHEFSYPGAELKPEDIILDIGGTGAVHTVIQSFINPGDNILIPSPGFPLYKSMALNRQAEARFYRLKPDQGWEIDFDDLESKFDGNSKLLVIINPSNPCGSVYSKEHLLDILKWASSHKICILADEIYHGMTYGKPHHPLGELTDDVPIFTIGALSKMFLVPGWRVGWIMIYDKQNKLGEIREAINRIKNLLLHPPPFIMQAIPRIFKDVPKNYFTEVMEKVKQRAELLQRKVDEVPCLSMSFPEGAIYCIISIDFSRLEFKNSVTFAEKLAAEEGVLVLPCEAFMSSNGFRLVLCQPAYVIEECMDRMKEMLARYTIRD
jgi:tyrosine aminotransferase